MKTLTLWAAIGAMLAVLAAIIIGREETYTALRMTSAVAYALVAISLWPVVRKKNSAKITHGLFGIAVCGALIFFYGAIYVALDRPHEWLTGAPYLFLLAVIGASLASVAHHLIAIGELQGRTRLYMFLMMVAGLAGVVTSWLLP